MRVTTLKILHNFGLFMCITLSVHVLSVKCQSDIDECGDTALNDCTHGEFYCKNTNGSYYCLCRDGFYGDGRESGSGCIPCNSTMYGSTCTQECSCVQDAGCRSSDGFCSGTNCGDATNTCDRNELEVKAFPLTQDGDEKASFTVICTVNLGPPDVTVNWTSPSGMEIVHDGMKYFLSTVSNTHSLMVFNAAGDDSGNYSCTGSLKQPTQLVTSKTAIASVLVWDFPEIENLILTGKTSSSLTFMWDISDSGNDVLTCRANYSDSEMDKSRPCQSSSSCTITDLSPYTAYNVTVECTNLAGYSNPLNGSGMTLSARPLAPRTTQVTDTKENCVVTWDESESANGPELKYQLMQSIKQRGEDAGEKPELVTEIEETSYSTNKEGMMKNSEYTFSICAYNGEFQSECTPAEGSCMTNTAAPDEIPSIEVPDPDKAVSSSSVTLTVPNVDDRNGPISCYEFVVVKSAGSGGGSPNDDVPFEEVKCVPDQNDSPYRSVVMNHVEYMTSDTLIIGSVSETVVTTCTLESSSNNRRKRRSNMVEGVDKLNATNAPLESGTSYDIFMRSYSETSDGMFQYTSSDYVKVTTADGDGGGASAGLIVFLILLILIIIIISMVIFAVWFRRTQKKEEQNMGSYVTYANEGSLQGSSSSNSKSNESTGYDETSVNETHEGKQEEEVSCEGVIYEEMPEDSNTYDQAVYVTDEAPLPFKVSELPTYVNKKRYQKNGLEREFKLLPQGQHYPWTIATKAENYHMNHHPNVLSYDHSRVKLTKVPGISSSDYYNASFIMDQHNKQAFIAAQGPHDNTVQEFLRLIWQEKVSIVVMVTPLEEAGKKLCSQYWPKKVSGKSSFGNMRVVLTSEEQYPHYSTRQLRIHPEDKSAVNVLQFHFPSWPFMGVPKKSTSLIGFIKCIKEALQERHFPVLVHCSDGSGATGTLIGAFCLMDELEGNNEISVYEFVKSMRKNRINMVQTKGQYVFLYDVLLQVYIMPHSELSAKDLKNMTIRENSLSKEFQTLRTPKYNVTAQSGASAENKEKNRFENTIPLDVHRPKLECSSLTGGNNYINACFVNSYRDKNAVVMTQSPLPTTVEDFWRLVIDLQCSTIVMLNETNSSDSKSCFCYWPIGGSVQYGNILVTCVNIKEEDTYVHRQFNVTHQSQKTVVSVDHFQLRTWPQKNITIWRDFIRNLGIEAHAGPTVVHCVDGCGHSGVFVTVFNELQRLRQKQVANVYETVQELRDNNPHAMQTLEHYTLCYEILQGLTDQN